MHFIIEDTSTEILKKINNSNISKINEMVRKLLLQLNTPSFITDTKVYTYNIEGFYLLFLANYLSDYNSLKFLQCVITKGFEIVKSKSLE